MARRSFAGGAVATTLASGLAAGATSASIAASTGWPDGSAGDFYIVIDPDTASEEKILVDTRAGTTLDGLTRGVDGTSDTSHSAGAVVKHVFTATDADEANAHVNDADVDGVAHAAAKVSYSGSAGLSATNVEAALDELDTEKSATGHTHAKTIRIDKTWAYDGTVAVNTLPGFYISLPSGQTAVLAAARHALGAGTATASVRVNGAAATGFSGLSLTTTSTLTNPADVAVADGDYIDLDVTAASSATELRLALFLDVTV